MVNILGKRNKMKNLSPPMIESKAKNKKMVNRLMRIPFSTGVDTVGITTRQSLLIFIKIIRL